MNVKWKISGTAVQGFRHKKEGVPCQDKIFSLTKGGVTAIALADGAGSAKLSHYGAESAVRAVCEELCGKFEEFLNAGSSDEVRRAVLSRVLSELEAVSREKGCSLHNLGSTLLAAADDGENLLLLHVGDGLIACCREGKIFAASLPDNGEFANETVFVTSRDAFRRMRLYKGKTAGISAVILMSDGADVSFYGRADGKFAELLDEIKQRCVMCSPEDSSADLEELFMSVVRENTNDDCSMILMCRPDEYFRGYRDLGEAERYDFLGIRSPKGKADREKVFRIFDGREYVSRRELVNRACEFGLKKNRAVGVVRELEQEGFIVKVQYFPRRYKLNFCY